MGIPLFPKVSAVLCGRRESLLVVLASVYVMTARTRPRSTRDQRQAGSLSLPERCVCINALSAPSVQVTRLQRSMVKRKAMHGTTESSHSGLTDERLASFYS